MNTTPSSPLHSISTTASDLPGSDQDQPQVDLINSTPHSVRSHGRRVAIKSARPLLESMDLAALLVAATPQPQGVAG